MSQDQSIEFLKPPRSVLDTIHHPSDYIHGIGKDKKPFRKIFKNTEYDHAEKEGIKQLKQLVLANKVPLPENFDDSDYLKFVYTGKFEAKKGLEALRKNLEWRNSMSETIRQEAFRLLEQGVFYQYGRDKQYRPIIILNIHKIDPKHNSEEHTLEALSFFLRKIQSSMFSPGKIENWIIILETNKMSFFKFPIGILKLIIQTLSVNFNATLEHLFILNPSTSFNVVWGGASSFIDSAQKEKISFISSKKDINKLYSKVELSQLEKKYGGQLDDITVNFWPPKNTIIKLGDPSVLDVDEEALNIRQDLKQSKIEQLKEFSKNIDGRISVLKPKAPSQSILKPDNPLEDQLLKRSVVNNPSFYSIRPSIPHLYESTDRVSILSGYSRPSQNRSIFKSAFSSFQDLDEKKIEDIQGIQEEKEEIYYSFHSFNENPVIDQPVEKKQWQQWSVLETENTKPNNQSTHTAEDKNRQSKHQREQNSHEITNDTSQKNISVQNSENSYDNTNQRSTQESRMSKKTAEEKPNPNPNPKDNSEISIKQQNSSQIANSKIENKVDNNNKSKAGERYRQGSIVINESKPSQDKDEKIKSSKYCCF